LIDQGNWQLETDRNLVSVAVSAPKLT